VPFYLCPLSRYTYYNHYTKVLIIVVPNYINTLLHYYIGKKPNVKKGAPTPPQKKRPRSLYLANRDRELIVPVLLTSLLLASLGASLLASLGASLLAQLGLNGLNFLASLGLTGLTFLASLGLDFLASLLLASLGLIGLTFLASLGLTGLNGLASE
jgi:hypothetical protein